MNTRIPTLAALLIAIAAAATAAGFEWRALYVRDHPPPHMLTAQACIKCHSDPASLSLMRFKEGNTHFLFNGSHLKGTHLTAPQWSPKTFQKLPAGHPATASSGKGDW